jgi:tRNA (guanine-N7-)-methyltransferase
VGKGKILKFAEVAEFGNVIQPDYKEVISGFSLKGKWAEEYFKNSNPIVLELACGKGEYTVNLAEKNADINYIGIDYKGARIWRGAKTAFENEFKNVAFLRIQIDWIEHCFAKDEINEIWITFPDPHPRKPKSRKRLTSPNFLNKFRNILQKDGIIHLKTDNMGLFDFTIDVINKSGHNLLEQTRDVYKTGCRDNACIVCNIQTFYEKMFLAKGLPIYYLKFNL